MARSRVIAFSTLVLLCASCCHATYKYSLAFWRELGARETVGSLTPGERTNGIYFHVWHYDGFPPVNLKIFAFDSTTNFQVGVIDDSGYGEVMLQTTNRYSFAITPAFFGTQVSPVFVTDRMPIPGQYSWEVGFSGIFEAPVGLRFNTNLTGVFNSTGSNACLDLNTPFTQSIAYGARTNFCLEPTTPGAFAASHGQTFIATGNRIVAAKVHFSLASTQSVSFTAQILEGGPGGIPIGPAATSKLIPDGHYLRSFVDWRDHDVQVVPGQTYYLKTTAETNLAVWREVDFYPGGVYYADDQPYSGYDLEALVVCGNYTPVESAGSISGTVRDSHGNPLRNVLVTTRFGNPPEYFYDATDHNGEYRIRDVRPATYRLTADGSGYTATTKTGIVVNTRSNTVVNFVLQNSPTNSGFIIGRLTDAQSAPLAEAHVVAQPGPHRTFTRPDGTFELGHLPATNYIVAFSKIGYVSEVLLDVPVRITQTNQFYFSLRPELLRNGNFERPLCTNDGVGTNWTRYITYSNGASRFPDQQYHLSGNYAQGIASAMNDTPQFDVGFHQRVPVLVGSNYQLSVWSTRTDDLRDPASIVETWAGIDPTGNTNPLSATIVWSPPEAQWDRWIRQTVEATAVSNTLTVFLRSRGFSTNGGMRAAFDDAVLEGEPLIPLNFAATPGPGRVTLTWEPLSSADAYIVRRATNFTGPFNVLASNLTQTTFVDATVRNEARYYYAIAAVRANESGMLSPVVEAMPTAHDVLVPAFAWWKYLHDGSDQSNSWRGVTFNDAGWNEGRAPLGLEFDCINTPVTESPDLNRFVTTYFRNSFLTSPGRRYTDLRLLLRVQDGAIAYLNGTEVVRNNMPANAVTYRTLARTNVFDRAAFQYHETRLPMALLRDGTNVVAVEVHTARTNASSMSFALELAGLIPSVYIRPMPGSMVLSWPVSLGNLQLQSAPQPGGAVQWEPVSGSFSTNGNVIEAEIPRAAAQQFYRLYQP